MEYFKAAALDVEKLAERMNDIEIAVRNFHNEHGKSFVELSTAVNHTNTKVDALSACFSAPAAPPPPSKKGKKAVELGPRVTVFGLLDEIHTELKALSATVSATSERVAMLSMTVVDQHTALVGHINAVAARDFRNAAPAAVPPPLITVKGKPGAKSDSRSSKRDRSSSESSSSESSSSKSSSSESSSSESLSEMVAKAKSKKTEDKKSKKKKKKKNKKSEKKAKKKTRKSTGNE